MPLSEAAFAGVGAGITALLLSVAGFVRRLSRDKTELVKDRAETDIIQLLTSQRKDAQDEVRQLKADLETIAEENELAIAKIRDLSAQNTQLKSQVALLNILVNRLAGNINQAPLVAVPLDTPDATIAAAVIITPDPQSNT